MTDGTVRRHRAARRTPRPVIGLFLAIALSTSRADALVKLQVTTGIWTEAALGGDVLIASTRFDPLQPPGAVRLFDGATGALLRTFNDPDPGSGRSFGSAVAAVSGNVLVGAPSYNGPAAAAYLFDGATGALLQTYPSPNPQTYDGFGTAVASFGTDVLVGSPSNDAVYLFDASTATLLRTFTNPFPPPPNKCPQNPACPDAFGAALATLGGSIVVGAPQDGDALKDERGSVYIIDGTTGALLHTLDNPTPTNVHVFGTRLAASGTSVLVGAPGRVSSGGGTDRGAAYLFDATTGARLLTVQSPKPFAHDFLGDSVAFLGTDLLVAAPGGGPVGGLQSAAYRFDSTGALVNAFYLSTTPVTAVSGNPVVGMYVYDGAPAPGDHYMCDTAALNARAGGVPIGLPSRTLADRYGSETCTVPKEQFVCPPAEKNLEGPPANPAIHQIEYQLRCPSALTPITGVIPLDQFHPGGVVVDLTKKVNLLVPSGKIDLGPTPAAPPQPVPPAPPALSVDHFLCYKVRIRSLTAVAPPFPVDVRDQFYPGGYPGLGLLKLVKLCTPVNKNGEDPTAPGHAGYLTCYTSRLGAGTPFAKTNVSTNNLNFGAQVLGVKRAGELCVPALVP